MSDSLTQNEDLLRSAGPGWIDRMARAAVLRVGEHISAGTIVLEDHGERRSLGLGYGPGLRATVTVHSPRFYRRVAFGGGFGAVDSYCDGDWSCDDLTALLRILSVDDAFYFGLDSGWTKALTPFRILRHRLRKNTRRNSRRNIAAHYDLGNDFFRLFLDETMSYSSAWFAEPGMSLGEASTEKIDRLCRKLELKEGEHLLEIGSGWGGLAMHAARHYGCRVTTVTLSQEQLAFTRELARQARLEDKVEVIYADYRELRGQYDKLVSVEMIEAVGYEYFDAFFKQCASLLKPDGLMALQAITRPDQGYMDYVRGTDFIREYIFPGGCVTSLGSLSASVGRASDLRQVHQEDFGPDYAETCKRWRQNLMAHWTHGERLGYDAAFLRLWEFYLRACEAGFAERIIGVSQLLYAKPAARPAVLR